MAYQSALLAEFVRGMRHAIKLAVEDSPQAGITTIAEYFEECGAGIDDPEMRRLLDLWWQKDDALTAAQEEGQ